ncbi:MAG TPA: hypothetical protein DDX04_03455 [Massilia sp.]|nr:hypothetical protein [Massilia sp.]
MLLPQAADSRLPLLDLRGGSPAALAGLVQPGDLVVAHPDWWRQVAALGMALPSDVVGVTSTAPCPDAVAQALQDGGLRLVQVYGSSETAGVGWRDRAGEPYRLFSYWRAVGGEVLERARAGGTPERHGLQDRLEWFGEAAFLPAGRIDHAVQVGGMNVFPAYVGEVLALHPDVLACQVRLMRADEGVRLKAFVVPRPGADDAAGLRVALGEWIGKRLTPPERPTAFSFGPKLPRGPGGKLADWIIDAWD